MLGERLSFSMSWFGWKAWCVRVQCAVYSIQFVVYRDGGEGEGRVGQALREEAYWLRLFGTWLCLLFIVYCLSSTVS